MMSTWGRQSPTQTMRCPAVIVRTAATALTLLRLPASHVSELLLMPTPTLLREALEPAQGLYLFHHMPLFFENLTALVPELKV